MDLDRLLDFLTGHWKADDPTAEPPVRLPTWVVVILVAAILGACVYAAWWFTR